MYPYSMLQDGSQLGRTTETLVLASSRPAGAARQQSLPVASGKAGSSSGNNEQDTIIIAAKARAAGSLAEHYARHAQSCNSAGSGEATATLRMPTPRAGEGTALPCGHHAILFIATKPHT